jgi:phosphoribosyl 1,2-cyclic phosphate phosphodiesterase
MRVTILGSSGNACTPWPTCTCPLCTRARTAGGRDVRYGNHLYLPELGLLSDASEHVFTQLNRFAITDVRRLVISHWHPDHTAGLRIIQALSGAFLNPDANHLDLYITRTVYEDIKKKISPALDHYLEESNTTITFLEDGVPIDVDGWTMTPITAPQHLGGPRTITYFLFEHESMRLFFAPDETKYLDLSRPHLSNLDLLIKECGYFTHDTEGERIVPEQFAIDVPEEITFEETIEQLETIRAKRVILTEIEESFKRTHEDYEALAARYAHLKLEFAYDGMEIEL